METLQTVIASFRRQVLAAVAERGGSSASALRLEPERVSLSLRVSINEQKAPNGKSDLSFQVMTHGGGDTSGSESATGAPLFHTVTVEFRVTPDGLVPSKEDQPETSPAKEVPAVRQVADLLVPILGAPGFDSSSRATVFREALAGLTDQQVRSVAELLRGHAAPDATPEMVRARQLLSRLVDSGSAGPVRGREILSDVFQRHPIEGILQQVLETWRTQAEWLHKPLLPSS